ncbi:MAG: NAD-dependent epimerase/dehydratase family protein [Candidatus Nanohaloarchaea archaeon]
MTRKMLITGANGTVGEAASEYLCGRGHEVIGVSRNIEDNECFTDTESIDLLDEDAFERLEELLEDVDAVFHLAWNIPEENFDTHSAWEGNMEIFENVIEAAREAGVPIFINGSSIHAGTGSIDAYTVDGSLEKTPEPYSSSIDPASDFDLRKDKPSKLLDPREEDPDSPYGWSKVITERATREATENGDIQVGVSIRIGGVNEEDVQEMEGEPYFSSLYWSHRDLGRLLEKILTCDLDERQGYHQIYGVSDNPGRIFDIENAFKP